MKFVCTFDCDNDAFWDHPEPEIGRLLDQIRRQVVNSGIFGAKILDVNGNLIGQWEIEGYEDRYPLLDDED